MEIFDDEKKKLDQIIAEAEQSVANAKKRLAKLEKVQKLFDDEPEPGTVLRFSRPLAGSSRKYTFVVTRIGSGVKSWYITGTENSLRLLGLTNKGNAWADVLVAIGDAKVKTATRWDDPTELQYWYFEDVRGTHRRQWKVDRFANKVVDFRVSQEHPWGNWNTRILANLQDLLEGVEEGRLRTVPITQRGIA